MTEALRLAAFAVLAALAAFALRGVSRQGGAAVALAAGMILFAAAVGHTREAAQAVTALSRKAGVGQETAQLLIKLVGMAYVAEFSTQACRDAGEEGLAMKAALCGKMLLLAQTLPLVVEIGEMALALCP